MAPRATRRSGLGRLGAAAVGCVALSGLSGAFVGAPMARTSGARVALRAEGEGSSVALVKVTEENTMTTASLLGGLAGLAIGGVWVGAGLFAAASYYARKEDDDVAKALKGIASGSLEALNFGGYVNDKYTVTGKIGSAISEAADKAKESGSGETVKTITGALDSAGEALESLDKDVGIKDTLGSLVTSASDLAFQAVEKAVELNGQYKITDQIAEKIEEATSSASKKASS